MRKIYKYNLFHNSSCPVILTRTGKIVHVGFDPLGIGSIWIEVEPDSDMVNRQLYIVATGGELPDAATNHVGSFVDGQFVWHIYE